MRMLTGLPLLVLALAVTGCGDDGEKESAGVCALVPGAEMEKAFGSPFGQGKLTHEDSTGADQCSWTSSGSASKTFAVTVLRQDGLEGDFAAGGRTVAQLFEQAKAAYPNAKPLQLGDESYAAVSEVQVLDGDTWYSFTAYLGAGADPIDALTTLAARVVG